MANENLYQNIIEMSSATPFRDAYIAEQQRQLENQSILLDQHLRALQIQNKAMEIEDYIANKPVREKQREQTLQETAVSMNLEQQDFLAQKLGQVSNQESYDAAKGEIQQAFPNLNLKALGFGEKYNATTGKNIDTLFSTMIHDPATARAEHLQDLKDLAAMNRTSAGKGTWSLKNVFDPKTNSWHTGAFHSGTRQLQIQDDRGNWQNVDKGGMLYASFQEGLPGMPSSANLKQVMPAVLADDDLKKLDSKEMVQVSQYIASRAAELMKNRQAGNIIDAQRQALDEAKAQYTSKEPNWMGSLFQGVGMPVPDVLQTTKFKSEGNWPGAPAIGAVEDGYKYTGGDPADPANWEEQ